MLPLRSPNLGLKHSLFEIAPQNECAQHECAQHECFDNLWVSSVQASEVAHFRFWRLRCVAVQNLLPWTPDNVLPYCTMYLPRVDQTLR